jgi:protein-tyrosine-phosphatase
MAAAYHNHFYSRYGEADSAGTRLPSGKNFIKEVGGAQITVDAMQEEGIDISKNKLTQLTPEMINDYDHIVVMAEPETWPAFLTGNKIEYLEVEDANGKDLETTRRIRDEIKERIDKRVRTW